MVHTSAYNNYATVHTINSSRKVLHIIFQNKGKSCESHSRGGGLFVCCFFKYFSIKYGIIRATI